LVREIFLKPTENQQENGRDGALSRKPSGTPQEDVLVIPTRQHGEKARGFFETRLAQSFAQQPRGWIFAEMAAILAVIGVLDFVITNELHLFIFYTGPIFVVAWFCGRKLGILTGAFSGVVWWYANWLSGDPVLHGWFQAWDMFRHIGFFLIVAWVGSALRVKSDIAAERIALLEHSHRLEREIVNISEAEQRRIGQDLHDGLCQNLAALSCAAESLRDDLQKLHLRAEAGSAGELADLLRDAVAQTRDLSRELVPAHVAHMGLVLALESLAQSVSHLHGVSCRFQFHGPPPNCDERAAMHLYRIAQEAINNATRHGKARTIVISLDAAGPWMTLRVLDDGLGISESVSPCGMGLAIMRYRARLSGGELSVARRNNGGTMISCTAKMAGPAREADSRTLSVEGATTNPNEIAPV
jgi:signal transduction histidine kinase